MRLSTTNKMNLVGCKCSHWLHKMKLVQLCLMLKSLLKLDS